MVSIQRKFLQSNEKHRYNVRYRMGAGEMNTDCLLQACVLNAWSPDGATEAGGIGFPGTRVLGSSESPDKNARNQT